MKSKTGPSHVEDRGSSRAESLGVAYTSAMFDEQWSQLLNLLKFPSQCPEFARNRKDPTFYILLIWTLLDFLPTLPPCSYLYSRCFRHTTAWILYPLPCLSTRDTYACLLEEEDFCLSPTAWWKHHNLHEVCLDHTLQPLSLPDTPGTIPSELLSHCLQLTFGYNLPPQAGSNLYWQYFRSP